MAIPISIPNPNMDKQSVEQANMTNAEVLKQWSSKVVSQNLLNLVKSSDTSFSSSTPATVNDLTGSVNCSGGLITIQANLKVTTPNDKCIQAALYVDNILRDYSIVGVLNNGVAIMALVLNCTDTLSKGNHLVEVKVANDPSGGGTSVVRAYSNLIVNEHLS